MTPDELKSLILYEDDGIFVLNKPAGLLVHPVAPDSVALTQFLPFLGEGVALAHRLDRETSGCLVLGRTPAMLKRLGGWFASGQIRKTYHALVQGRLEGSGVIDVPLAKHKGRMCADAAGHSAVTEWQSIEQRSGQTLVELHPRTGRTHQLRAHMAHLGYPIVGDVKYGGPPATDSDTTGPVKPRMMLHASRIALPGHAEIAAPLPF